MAAALDLRRRPACPCGGAIVSAQGKHMSDDLVNRLRREAGTLATMYAAADEIERLRADNKRLTDKLMKIAEKETYT